MHKEIIFRNNPIVIRSGLENKILKGLPKTNGVKVEYEKDKLDYVVRRRYSPDLTVTLPNGRKIFIEIKGYLRPEDRTKMIAVKAFNPDADIRIVFGRDNKLSKKSKTTYSEWAKKNGFQYAIGRVPKEWFR